MDLKILIIDDDLVLQALLKTIIKNHYQTNNNLDVVIDSVCTIEHSHLMLEKMMDNNIGYDLIFLDLTIEHKNDGMQLLKVIKGIFLRTLVVVISADSSQDTIVKTDLSGASGFIQKPLFSRSSKITQILDRLCKLKKLEKELVSNRINKISKDYHGSS